MNPQPHHSGAPPRSDSPAHYDDEAEATGWYGPEVAFGLAYADVAHGQRILDLGIGTGLGSALFAKAGLIVHGMDVSPEMLQACRDKGVAHLVQHDLRAAPYPFADGSMDHAVCTGVMGFFEDLSVIFTETSRILRPGGLFVFVAGDREAGAVSAVTVGGTYTPDGRLVTLYRHSHGQMDRWCRAAGFTAVRNLAFTAFMDRARTQAVRLRAYVVRSAAP